jgi:two-component system LytT family response regulator
MQKIRIIHIEDEKQTLEYCKTIFNSIETIEYKGGFINAVEAVEFLKSEKIDLVFCDIEMPKHNGCLLYTSDAPDDVYQV